MDQDLSTYITHSEEIFILLLTELPPKQIIAEYILKNDIIPLQDFCSSHVKVQWMTGLSVIDAVDSILGDAISNGAL